MGRPSIPATVRSDRCRTVGGFLARAAVGAYAAYLLRLVLVTLAHSCFSDGFSRHSAAPAYVWLVAAFGLGVAVTLREAARGLFHQVEPPRLSPRFAALWLFCASVLLTLLAGHDLLHATVGSPHALLGRANDPAGWSAVPAALIAGFGLASALCNVGTVVRLLLRQRVPDARKRQRSCDLRARSAAWPQLAALANGRSSRGPPVAATAVVLAGRRGLCA